MTSVEFRPTNASFPLPADDSLGLAADKLLVAATYTDAGQKFVAVHTRPFAGESLNFFLHQCAASSYSNNSRISTQSSIEPLNVRRLSPHASEDDRAFIKEEARLHYQIGGYGIGASVRAFERDVRTGWQEALDDPLTDSVYSPLLRAQVFTDLSEAARWQIGEWKARIPKEPTWRGAAAVHEVLTHVAPTKELEAIKAKYSWRSSEEAYLRFGRELCGYLDRLPQEESENIIGKAYSQLADVRQYGAHHTQANQMVLSMSDKKSWMEIPLAVGDLSDATDEPLFPEPTIEFVGGSVQISDDKDTSVKLNIREEGNLTAPVEWSISAYTLPPAYYANGRFAVVAWQTDRRGEREFCNQEDTVRAVQEAGLPIEGHPDSYLGKLLVKYFEQEGEYQSSVPGQKWLTSMGLPGSDQQRKITVRELPVWIQLAQHQQDLLASEFVRAAETRTR